MDLKLKMNLKYKGQDLVPHIHRRTSQQLGPRDPPVSPKKGHEQPNHSQQ